MKARILLVDDHEVLRESEAARNLVLAMDALLGGTFF